MRPTRGRASALAGALAILVATGAGCAPSPERVGDGASSSPPPTRSPADSGDRSPLAEEKLYLDPAGDVAVELARAREEQRGADAAALEELAEPTARWFAGQYDDPTAEARALTEAAAAQGQTPVLVLYNIPNRDCGLYSEGGAPDAEAYKAWVGQIGAGLGDRPAVVVLEPDAVPQALTGCEGLDDPAERYQMLSESVDILRKQPGARVYLDAGNASWVANTGALAETLAASGLSNAAGFSLNVSNFATTEASAEYGQRLSDAADGARFVIDTSRNGAGPAPPDDEGLEWCNPPSARVGSPPTTEPGLDRVDALLWVKQPGDSDGDCRTGEPPAGEFWPEYAAALVS